MVRQEPRDDQAGDPPPPGLGHDENGRQFTSPIPVFLHLSTAYNFSLRGLSQDEMFPVQMQGVQTRTQHHAADQRLITCPGRAQLVLNVLIHHKGNFG